MAAYDALSDQDQEQESEHEGEAHSPSRSPSPSRSIMPSSYFSSSQERSASHSNSESESSSRKRKRSASSDQDQDQDQDEHEHEHDNDEILDQEFESRSSDDDDQDGQGARKIRRTEVRDYLQAIQSFTEHSDAFSRLWTRHQSRNVHWPSMELDPSEQRLEDDAEAEEAETPLVLSAPTVTNLLFEPARDMPERGVSVLFATDLDAPVDTDLVAFGRLLEPVESLREDPLGFISPIHEAPTPPPNESMRTLKREGARWNALATECLTRSGLEDRVPSEPLSRDMLASEVMEFVRSFFGELLRGRLQHLRTSNRIHPLALTEAILTLLKSWLKVVPRGDWQDALAALRGLLPKEVLAKVRERTLKTLSAIPNEEANESAAEERHELLVAALSRHGATRKAPRMTPAQRAAQRARQQRREEAQDDGHDGDAQEGNGAGEEQGEGELAMDIT